jgi:hypothetical protein
MQSPIYREINERGVLIVDFTSSGSSSPESQADEPTHEA